MDVGEGVTVKVGTAVAVCVGRGVVVRVAVGLAVSVGTAVVVNVGEGVGDGVGVGVSVGVGVGVGVEVAVGVGVGVGVGIAASLSTSETVVEVVPLAEYPEGRVPKPIVTLSLSSFSLSSVAVTVKVFEVSDVVKFRVCGTPEKSASVAPPLRPVTRIGMSTDAGGASLKVTATGAPAPPSVAVYDDAPKPMVIGGGFPEAWSVRVCEPASSPFAKTHTVRYSSLKSESATAMSVMPLVFRSPKLHGSLNTYSHPPPW